jgi:hypothetical protein
MYFFSPLHPSENIPSPSHRTSKSKNSGDPFYLKNDKNHCDTKNEIKDPPSASETKQKSHNKKHKKDKSGKSSSKKVVKGKDIDLLIEDQTITQNGSQHFEELVTPMDDGLQKSVESYVDTFLEDLDPVKSSVNQKNVPIITSNTDDNEQSISISQEEFADLLAGGELKFKRKLEIPNDLDMKKVIKN